MPHLPMAIQFTCTRTLCNLRYQKRSLRISKKNIGCGLLVYVSNKHKIVVYHFFRKMKEQQKCIDHEKNGATVQALQLIYCYVQP